jgi:hypothetical protein
VRRALQRALDGVVNTELAYGSSVLIARVDILSETVGTKRNLLPFSRAGLIDTTRLGLHLWRKNTR